MTKRSMLQGSSVAAALSKRPAGWVPVLIVAVALLVPARTTAALADPRPRIGIDSNHAAQMLEPVQFSSRRGARRDGGSYGSRRRRDFHGLSGGGTHRHEGLYGRRHRYSNSGRDGRRRPRGHRDNYEQSDNHPGHKHRHNHRHRPYLPPVVIPDTVEERAQYFRSLPRRAQQAPQAQASRQTVARQILVLVDQNRPSSVGLDLARSYDLQRLSSRPIALLGARAELFRIRGSRSDTAVLAALQRDGRIRSAQFNRRYFHTGDFARQVATVPQYGPRNVHLSEAHQLALGRKVMIAVINSAVDTTHPDLKGAVARSFDAAGSRQSAPDFHGTAVAGIIRSRGIVEGIAPQAEIMAVRAFWTKHARALPETNTDVLLSAIDWAVGNGARILNMSFVGPRDAALEALLETARKRRIVMVAAAGNAGPEAAPAYPAAYPGVIAVTAVDEKDRRYRHSNRGSYIAVAAPGVDVLAPVERGGHSYLSGTSFAAAYVSGIAALLLERDPNLDAQSLGALIAAGADDLGPVGRDDDYGAGRINAFRSLISAPPPPDLATRQ